jgi:uncharacterized protein YcbK (DUF882 family)
VRILLACKRILLLLVTLLTGLPAAATPSRTRPAKHGKVEKPGGKYAARQKARKVRRPIFQGHANLELRQEPLARASGNLHLYSVNYRDEVKVNIYKPDGSFDEDAIAKLNHFVRSRGAGTERHIEPRLYEILSHIYDHYEGRVLEFVSGFRDQPRETSYHYLGSAMDMRVRGIPVRALRDYVRTLDTGGMGLGLYPRVGFIHVDVRPEPSYYWTDWSGHAKPKRHARRVPRS